MHGGAIGRQGKAGAATDVELFTAGMAVWAFGDGDNLKIRQSQLV